MELALGDLTSEAVWKLQIFVGHGFSRAVKFAESKRL
jgi:hypothetical protein